MTNANRTPQQRAAAAACLSMSEFLGMATLVDDYSKGQDMTETLQNLLKIQELKRVQGISPADMRGALNNKNVQSIHATIGGRRRPG